MPQFLPPGPPAQQGAAPTPHPLAKKLQVWVKGSSFIPVLVRSGYLTLLLANYDNAMRAVAFTELLIMARVTLGALTWRLALFAPVIYAHFLRQRWYQSKFTREAVAYVHTKILAFVSSPGRPPVLAQVYTQIVGLVGRWAGSTLNNAAAQNGNDPGAAGAGAGARRQ